MNNGIKFYKIKLIQKIIKNTADRRNTVAQELVNNATDPTIVKRRIRMLNHLNLYENQLISKIQNFKTDDVDDLNQFDIGRRIGVVSNSSA
jgi:hypothetical protein